jgi:membrane-associated protease RseP (regulator of RpoE activity)
MKKVLLAAALASAAFSAHAASSDQWFYDGMAWYEHPCGGRAFAKYGHDDSPAVRHAYEITKHDSAQCEELFPTGPDRLGLLLSPRMAVEDASGPAARAGIQPGDIVLAVDGIPLESAVVLRPFENVTGTVALLIRRGDDTFYVPVVLED